LPPDHEGEAPAGYFAAKSPTYGVWLGVRGFLVDGKSDQGRGADENGENLPSG
jgi:hypothetical protein